MSVWLGVPQVGEGQAVPAFFPDNLEITTFLTLTSVSHPTIATLQVIGLSSQAKPIAGLKIGNLLGSEPAVVFTCGASARDWITTARVSV